ncbi:hypothetical protein BDZ94DRAFT_1150500, partial [Collybia nuda]
VSSSSTLWATASKEWIIQPKPKPGRKPKKDVAPPPKSEEQLDNKGRRVQNRAAQRAFRERKQSQLAELQARVQSYEQGEIERNVALQNIAKRLKEENEALRLENSLLKERMSKVERDNETPREHDRKRWRDDSPMSNVSLAPPTASKRAKVSTDSPRTHITTSYTPSPPSMVSSPGSNGTSDTRFSPLPYETQSDPTPSQFSNIINLSPNPKSHAMETNDSFPAFDCGFCNEDTPCVCREIAVQQAAERLGVVDFKAENYSQASPLMHLNQIIRLETAPVAPRASILENLPAYQPPVPLRRRTGAPAVNSVFPVAPPLPVLQRASAPDNNCSGDPSNCVACADDAFGKAFCLAIEESVSTQAPCGDCPCTQGQTSHTSHSTFSSIPGSDCCTNPTGCDCPTNTTRPTVSRCQSESKTIPTNDAWLQIKSHPNVAFADLALLADVVARRSKCTGPKVIISPALGSITPERSTSPGPSPINPQTSDQGSVLLTDPHAHYRERERARSSGPSSPPTLVPQEVLIRCGRQRVREVQADAVQAALRLLDAKF